METASLWPWLLAALLGGGVGIGELVSRYRDAPVRALLTLPAWFYVAVNASAAMVAYWLLLTPNWLPNLDAIERVLVAGLGAMAFFRSSLFTVRIGDNDVAVGPSAFLQIILSAADRAVDRSRATPRAQAIGDIMKDVNFAKAAESLPAHCFALMQNVSAEEQEAIGQQVNSLKTSAMEPTIKSLNLGLALMNVVGESVLRAAVTALGDRIKGAESRAAMVSGLMAGISFEKARITLTTYCLALHGGVPETDQALLAGQIEALAAAAMADEIKSLQLGLALIPMVGEPVLRAAVQATHDQIKL